MALITGSPVGNVSSQDEIYIEGAPNIWIQDATANPLFNPDASGLYWGMSGTTTYPAIGIGCISDVSLTEGLTMNAIVCDTDGQRGMIQRRDYLELNVTISTLFPLTSLRHILNLSTPIVGLTDIEKVGIGQINNNRYYMVYAPRVYDPDTGDYVLFHFHRAQFVDAWSISMTGGEAWKVTGLKLRAFSDSSKPASSSFGTIVRADPSAI